MWLKSSSLFLLFIIFNVAKSRHLGYKESHPNNLPANALMKDPYTIDGEAEAKKYGYNLKEIFENQLKDVLVQIQQLGESGYGKNESKMEQQPSKHALMDDPYVLTDDGYDTQKPEKIDGAIGYHHHNGGGYGNGNKLGDHGIMDEPPSDDENEHERFQRDTKHQTTTETPDAATTAAVILIALLFYVVIPISFICCYCVLPVVIILYFARRNQPRAVVVDY